AWFWRAWLRAPSTLSTWSARRACEPSWASEALPFDGSEVFVVQAIGDGNESLVPPIIAPQQHQRVGRFVVAIRCAQHRFLRRCPRARGVARVVRRIVLARSWTLRRAAAALGVAQADVSDLMRGKHARFSRERLERSSSRSTACLSSREVTPLCQRLATHGVESTRFESLEQHDFARSRTSLHARTVRDNQSADCRTAAPIPSTCASRAAASPPNASPRRAN